MTRRLVLLRHGETDHNRAGRAQGHLDVRLNDRGLAQARAVAPVIAAFGPAWIVSSDLQRASATARTIAEYVGRDIVVDGRLREFHAGYSREDRTWAEFEAAFPDQAVALLEGREELVPGRETRAQLLSRWRPALTEALRAVPIGGCGVLVAHGAALRAAVADFLGFGEGAPDRIGPLGNCGWAVLTESGPTFPEQGDALTWRLSAWNQQVNGA